MEIVESFANVCETQCFGKGLHLAIVFRLHLRQSSPPHWSASSRWRWTGSEPQISYANILPYRLRCWTPWPLSGRSLWRRSAYLPACPWGKGWPVLEIRPAIVAGDFGIAHSVRGPASYQWPWPTREFALWMPSAPDGSENQCWICAEKWPNCQFRRVKKNSLNTSEKVKIITCTGFRFGTSVLCN